MEANTSDPPLGGVEGEGRAGWGGDCNQLSYTGHKTL